MSSSLFSAGYFGARLSLFTQAGLDRNPILYFLLLLG
jgi:hypothetical protein